jgi:hypothetical protein
LYRHVPGVQDSRCPVAAQGHAYLEGVEKSH